MLRRSLHSSAKCAVPSEFNIGGGSGGGGEEARTNSLVRETNGFGACTLPLDRETMSLATRVAAREENGTRGPRAIFILHGRAERLFYTKLLRSIPQKNAFDGKLTRADFNDYSRSMKSRGLVGFVEKLIINPAVMRDHA